MNGPEIKDGMIEVPDTAELTAKVLFECKEKPNHDSGIDPASHWIISGGDSTCPSWEVYLTGFGDLDKAYPKAIRKALEDADIVGFHSSTTCPKCYDSSFANHVYYRFSNGKEMSFTWRANGDLMQAIVNKNEGYLEYY